MDVTIIKAKDPLLVSIRRQRSSLSAKRRAASNKTPLNFIELEQRFDAEALWGCNESFSVHLSVKGSVSDQNLCSVGRSWVVQSAILWSLAMCAEVDSPSAYTPEPKNEYMCKNPPSSKLLNISNMYICYISKDRRTGNSQRRWRMKHWKKRAQIYIYHKIRSTARKLWGLDKCLEQWRT